MNNTIESPETPYCVIKERERTKANWDEIIMDLYELLYIEQRLKANGIDINELEEA